MGTSTWSCATNATQEAVRSIESIRQELAANASALAAAQSEDRQNDAHVAWLTGGILKIDLAVLDTPNRERLLMDAQETMEDLVLDAGEESAMGQSALLQLARIEEVRGDLDLALRRL